MPLSTGIKTQRSAVVLLSGVTFEHNPNNIDGQQQVKKGGVAIEATDSSTIYIKEQIIFNLNADKWFRAAHNSNIRWLADFDIIVSNQASDAAVIPFDLYHNSTIDLKAGVAFGRFNNNSTLTLTQLLSGTKIDTSSSLYINNNLETEVKKDATDIKGSLNNIFYSGGEPYVVINEGSTPPLPIANSIGGIAIGGGSVATNLSSTAVGSYAKADNNAVALGSLANASSIGAISIGRQSEASGNYAVAIGDNSKALADEAIQIGKGTNNSVNTLQFLSNTIANSQGIQAPVTTGTNLQSPPAGSIYVDDTNGSERICVYLNGGWKCADLT